MLTKRLDVQRLDSNQFAELRWRMIGLFRASRTKAAVGIPDQPNAFYVGAVDGGVRKTNDASRAWLPIGSDDAVVVRWNALSRARLTAINALLTRARLQPMAIPN
ncbi:MAG: hypothetical protein ABI120_21685 [Gemmatimonadaceae bacterium]